MAAMVLAHRRAGAALVVDVGGGYGTDVTSRLKENGINFQAFNGANKADGMSAGGLKFYNARAAALWAFREALNPDQEGGSTIALPDDPELLADLTAPTFEVRTGGILIESKEAIRKRLGRSTNKGDAVVMAWSEGEVARRRMNIRHMPAISPSYDPFRIDSDPAYRDRLMRGDLGGGGDWERPEWWKHTRSGDYDPFSVT
jgi:hypothetical protein